MASPMKQIAITVTIDSEGRPIANCDTYDGDALNPHEFGKCLAAIVRAATRMMAVIGDAYAAEGKSGCVAAMREAFAQSMNQSVEVVSSRVTSRKGRGDDE